MGSCVCQIALERLCNGSRVEHYSWAVEKANLQEERTASTILPHPP